MIDTPCCEQFKVGNTFVPYHRIEGYLLINKWLVLLTAWNVNNNVAFSLE